MSDQQRLRLLCVEYDLAVPSDAIVLAILDAAQQVQLLHHALAIYSPDILYSRLIFDQFVLWALTPPSARYVVLPDDEPPHPLADAIQQ